MSIICLGCTCPTVGHVKVRHSYPHSCRLRYLIVEPKYTLNRSYVRYVAVNEKNIVDMWKHINNHKHI